MRSMMAQSGGDAQSGVEPAGALDAGDEEAIKKLLVRAVEAAEVRFEIQIQIRHRCGKQAPHAGLARSAQLDFFVSLLLQESQRGENVLNAVGVVALVER